MSTALLLIDVQQSFTHRPYWSENDLPSFLAKTNALIQGAMAQAIPIVRVFHVDGPIAADNHFSIASGIKRLIVAGIRTEQCCETTTRHAIDEGWQVDFVGEATLTFDMRTPSGETLTAAQIRERTETVLVNRFATLCAVE